MEVTLDQLSSEFASVSRRSDKAAGAVIKKGALVVKLAARKSSAANSGAHAAGAPHKINFDMLGTTDAEIGYDKEGQGKLGNLLEFGSVNNGPHDDLGMAVESEAPNVEKYLAKALDDLWR